MSKATKPVSTEPLSATNYNFSLLYLLMPEINVTLNNAETHLGEFSDDDEQIHLLLDSIEMLKQLSVVLNLIHLEGATELAELLAKSMQKLYDEGDNSQDEFILDISEGVIILGRYIEFVLLKETLEPNLLISIINRLNKYTNTPQLDESAFTSNNYRNISIAEPKQNYESIKDLDLDELALANAYRAGLSVTLTKKDNKISEIEQNKLNAMYSACAMIAKHSQSLFWQAAQAATKDIAAVLPLNNAQKRALIFLEQQFHNYLPTSDSRFADLVSFACTREHNLAQKVQQLYQQKRSNSNIRKRMQRYLVGPDRQLATTLNQLIQDEIDTVKNLVDAFVRHETVNSPESALEEISAKLNALASTMQLINIPDASDALQKVAIEIKTWENPSPEDFDELLSSLIIAEDAAIYLAKSHTPGVILQPIHNSKISMYQLDTSYATLVKQSRLVISQIEQVIHEYIENDAEDSSSLIEIKDMLKQVSGAVKFLGLTDGANMLSRLSRYVETAFKNPNHTFTTTDLANIADVVLTIDYYLNAYENTNPINKNVMQFGHQSLNRLLAA